MSSQTPKDLSNRARLGLGIYLSSLVLLSLSILGPLPYTSLKGTLCSVLAIFEIELLARNPQRALRGWGPLQVNCPCNVRSAE
jgi:hypothetical protein